eukprot:961931-Amorphochlora_amoeboformis.AAC.1
MNTSELWTLAASAARSNREVCQEKERKYLGIFSRFEAVVVLADDMGAFCTDMVEGYDLVGVD